MMTRKYFVSTLALMMIMMGSTAKAQAVFGAAGQWAYGTMSDGDPTKPVNRGYIVVDAEPAVGGAKIKVKVFQNTLNKKVVLSLYAAVNNGAQSSAVPIKLLDAGTPDPTFYIQQHEFFLSYAELDTFFGTAAPNATGLRSEPGMALAIKADFEGGHNWGGFDRGGIFYLPTPLDQNGRLMVELNKPKVVDPSAPAAGRTTALDVAYPITQEMTNTYNDMKTKAGLKLNGQIRSRLEGEGKFQLSGVETPVVGPRGGKTKLTQSEFIAAKKRLFDLVNDPAAQLATFGPGWKITPETRYYKKDAAGNFLKDAHGLPIPDPMVDTYYDNAKLDAAANDMAIRYRWTEGNQTGSWNFKPTGGRTDKKSGIVYRLEYGMDTTDDKPETIREFVDSMHPLNPFQVIRQIVPGAKPSEFLYPSAKVKDVRHKFKLEGPNNLIIEISTDHVETTNLRNTANRPVDYYQIEMDIDHLSTSSQNVAQVKSAVDYTLGGLSSVYNWNGFDTNTASQDARTKYMAALDGKAFVDGRPVLHTLEDLSPTSPILTSRAHDFNESARVISALRDVTIGKVWRPAPQKYALAAAGLEMLPKSRYSRSTKKVADMIPDIRFAKCSDLFSK